jgi:hypothetical protein
LTIYAIPVQLMAYHTAVIMSTDAINLAIGQIGDSEIKPLIAATMVAFWVSTATSSSRGR